MQQGRDLVLRQLPRRSAIAGQLLFDKRLGVAQRPVGLARAGGLAPARRAAAEVPPRRRTGQLHLASADTTPDKPGQRVARCRCLSAMRRQPRLHRCKIRPADERHVGAGYDDPILPRQADDSAGLVIQLAQEGMTVMFISSEIEEMLRTVNRLCVLRDGKKVGELNNDNLTQEDVMAAIAGGDGK